MSHRFDYTRQARDFTFRNHHEIFRQTMYPHLRLENVIELLLRIWVLFNKVIVKLIVQILIC